MGRKMMSLGVAELFQRMWKLHSGENFVDKATDPLYINLSNIMVVMWNMTDKCTTLCEHSLDIGVHEDALKFMNAINPQETNSFRYAELQTDRKVYCTIILTRTNNMCILSELVFTER